MSFIDHVHVAKARNGNNMYFPRERESKSDEQESSDDLDSKGISDEESNAESMLIDSGNNSDGKSNIKVDEILTIMPQRYENL
jgi:predicted secreted acid phosphatase